MTLIKRSLRTIITQVFLYRKVPAVAMEAARMAAQKALFKAEDGCSATYCQPWRLQKKKLSDNFLSREDNSLREHFLSPI